MALSDMTVGIFNKVHNDVHILLGNDPACVQGEVCPVVVKSLLQ